MVKTIALAIMVSLCRCVECFEGWGWSRIAVLLEDAGKKSVTRPDFGKRPEQSYEGYEPFRSFGIWADMSKKVHVLLSNVLSAATL